MPLSHLLVRLLVRLLRWKVLSMALLACALAGPAAWAAGPLNPIGGVRFEPQLQLAGQTLLLNGTGLRALLWIKGYAAGLYLGQRAGNAEEVLALPGAKRLQLRLLMDVPAAEFVKAFHQGLERNNPPEVQAALTERAARFDALLKSLGQIRKGDAVNLDYLPGKGLLFSHNGRLLGEAIPGADFYAALLRVFVGEHVSDEKLRAGLLGKAA